MEVRPQTLSLVQCRFHNQQNSSNSPNNNLPRRFSNMTYNNLENGNRAGALRCASNPPADPKSRPKRDFRFQVIEVRQGPKWFIWPSNKEESEEGNTSYDQENCHDQSRVSRREGQQQSSAIPIMNSYPNNNFAAPMSEPTSRRILHQQPQDQRNMSLSMSPPSSSTSSNQSSISSYNSNTFQILSVASKWESEDEEEDEEEPLNRSGSVEAMNMSPDMTPIAEPQCSYVEKNNN